MTFRPQEMSAQVQQVVGSTQELDGMAQTLQQAVAAFKLDSNTSQNGSRPTETEGESSSVADSRQRNGGGNES